MNRSRPAWVLGRLVLVGATLLAPCAGAAAPEPVHHRDSARANVVEAQGRANADEGQGRPISLPDAAIRPIEERDHRAAGDADGLGRTLFTTFLSLGVIMTLIYLTLNFGLRRLMVARGIPFGRPGVVKVVERVSLDPKRVLFVVGAAGEYLLVGSAGHGLSLITALDADEVERVLDRGNATSAKPGAFLRKLLSRKGEAPLATGEAERV